MLTNSTVTTFCCTVSDIGDSIFVSDDASQLIAYIDARGENVHRARQHMSETSAHSSCLSFALSPLLLVPATDDSLAAASAAVAPSSVAAVSAVSPDGSSSPSDPSSEPPRPAPLAARAPPLRSRLALHSRTGSLAAAASNSWVLQRYIDRPFLIQRRKFDIRCWILVDAEYRVFLYRNGVCRTSSTEFNMENLGDTFVHLTNHCIQEAHPDFNKQEQGNELFFPELQTSDATQHTARVAPRMQSLRLEPNS